MRLTNLVCYGTLLGICAACASAQTGNAPPTHQAHQANEPPSHQELKQKELASERREYIQETQKRLSEIDRDMQHVQAKLDHESKFVGQNKRESWKQDLFELREERERLQRRLERARSASPAEWEAMRGPIGTATDSLQASVKKLRVEVADAFRSDETDTANPPTDSPLCRVDVSGVEADVERAGNGVTVTLTAEDEGNVAELQRRAVALARSTDSYRVARHEHPAKAVDAKPTTANADKPGTDPTTDQAMHKQAPPLEHARVPVNVVAEKMATGAKLTFVPKAGEVERLRARLAFDAENLEEGRCQEAQVSLNTPSK